MGKPPKLQQLKPLFPYCGGKWGKLKYFKHKLRKCDTYMELFFGSGAVFCNMFNNNLFRSAIINDNNQHIIRIYEAIKNGAEDFLRNVQVIINDYNSFKEYDKTGYNCTEKVRKRINRGDPKYTKRHCYYEYRDLYCKTKKPEILYFLMLTCYSGSWRFSKNGEFNTSSGYCVRRLNLNVENIRLWNKALQNTEIFCRDYEQVPIPHGDVLIYCDPIYHNSHHCYSQPEMATTKEQIRILEYFKNRPAIISNATDGKLFETISRQLGYQINYFDAKHFGNPNKVFKNVQEVYLVSSAYNSPVAEHVEGHVSTKTKTVHSVIHQKPAATRMRVLLTFPRHLQTFSFSCMWPLSTKGFQPPRARPLNYHTGIPPPIIAATMPLKCISQIHARIATAKIARFLYIVNSMCGGKPPSTALTGTAP